MKHLPTAICAVTAAALMGGCGSDAGPSSRTLHLNQPALPNGVAEIEGSAAWATIEGAHGWTKPRAISGGQPVRIPTTGTVVTVYRQACPCPRERDLAVSIPTSMTTCTVRIPRGTRDVTITGTIDVSRAPSTCRLILETDP